MSGTTTRAGVRFATVCLAGVIGSPARAESTLDRAAMVALANKRCGDIIPHGIFNRLVLMIMGEKEVGFADAAGMIAGKVALIEPLVSSDERRKQLCDWAKLVKEMNLQ